MHHDFPAGPKGLPIIGNAFAYQRDPLGFAIRLEREYGAIASYPFLNIRLVFATRAESVRYVLIENARNFMNREVYFSLIPLLGDGLLTIDGDLHKQHRRLVQPAFHRRRVESYGDLMTAYALETVEHWRPGQVLDMVREMQKLTLKVVAKALFNVDLREESGVLGQAFTASLNYLNNLGLLSFDSLPLNLPFTAYGRFMRAKATLDAAIYQIIGDHRRSGHDIGDVLSMLLHAPDEAGSALSDSQLHDHIMTLLAAGHETTAVALSWTFYLLAEHPDVRQKLMDEIGQVVGNCPPTVADLEHMPYLEMVVKESMRLYPPVWSVARQAINDFELEGYKLPGGTMVVLSQYITHRLPQYWTEPHRFWPERFSPEQKEPREDFAYFPFGAGPRMCIGMPFAMMEARLLLATILQHFTPTLVSGARIVPKPLVTLRPRYGMPMVLFPSQAQRTSPSSCLSDSSGRQGIRRTP
ncbi:MAG: cytochrome P450 [Chloroflexi bacterium]|nr:cytochrome P450 [Chloroflexota bacterium]